MLEKKPNESKEAASTVGNERIRGEGGEEEEGI